MGRAGVATSKLPTREEHVMRRESRSFLKKMLAAPSPSGYEQPVQRVWREYVGAFADGVTTDVHGNAIAVVNPEGSPRVMLAGHCDELGFQINYIADGGFLHFDMIGAHILAIVPGRRVTVHSANGPVSGVIGKRFHFMTAEDRDKPQAQVEEYWIDIAVADKEEAEGLVAVGDPVTYDLAFQDIRNGTAVSRGFDDKAGAFVVAETLRQVAEARGGLKAAVFAVSTVQEEIGERGAHTSAYGIDPDVGIAVDVTHATDSPDMDKRKAGDVKMGGGPVISRGPTTNPVVFDQLLRAGRKEDIALQVEADPRSAGTDADAIQLTKAGVAAGLLSVPLRYLHTPVEMLSLADLDSSARLLTSFCLNVRKGTSFVPE